MSLEALRKEIDAIDDKLLQAFQERMAVVAQVSQAKRAGDLPVLEAARERSKLEDIASKLPEELQQYGYFLWSMLFEISRSHQSALDPQPSPLRLPGGRGGVFPAGLRKTLQAPPGDVLRQLRERLFRHRERLLRLRRAAVGEQHRRVCQAGL